MSIVAHNKEKLALCDDVENSVRSCSVHRKYKRYVAMQTNPHVIGYLYSLALRGDAVNSVRSFLEF